MRSHRQFACSALSLGMLAMQVLVGCASRDMVTINDVEGHPHEICRNCLEVAKQFVREGKPKDAPFGSEQVVFKQICGDCGTDMEIRDEAEIWVLHCPRCSVAGIANRARRCS